jgi:protein tyrosine phosphatase
LTKAFYISAPVLDDIEIPRYETTLNGTLFPLPEISIARQEPSAENDAAWHQFEKVLTHVVTREQIIKLGKDPEKVARFDDEYWGMGDDAYMVQLDVMHVRSSLFSSLASSIEMTQERNHAVANTKNE